MKKILFVLTLFILSIFYSACSSYAFMVDSNPPAADLKIKNSKEEVVYTAKTPAKILSKYLPQDDFTVTLSKSGYKETEIFRNGNPKKWKLKEIDLGIRSLEKNDQ